MTSAAITSTASTSSTSTTRITESVRAARLRRPLVPSVTKDSELAGFALVVTRSRAFWALFFQPRGINPRTGRRYGGGVRLEISDAHQMSVQDARAAALTAKAQIRLGRDPHREKMALRANVEAARSIIPMTVAEALDAYSQALMARTAPSLATREQSVRYARKAIRLMRASALPIVSVDVRMIRIMLETMSGSQAEKRLVHGGLSRFLTWCRRQQLIEANPCGLLEPDERPRPGPARANVPSLEELRDVWRAVESKTASVRDAVRLLLLTALRRDEVGGLTWGEVDLVNRRLVIPGARMKNRELHEVPLSAPALDILKARMPANPAPRDIVFSSSAGSPITTWGRVLIRIRKAIGQADLPKAQRFVLHDIRRSFASLLADEFDPDALDRALAHKRAGVAGTYNRSSRAVTRAKAFARWAELIVGDNEASNVVPLARSPQV